MRYLGEIGLVLSAICPNSTYSYAPRGGGVVITYRSAYYNSDICALSDVIPDPYHMLLPRIVS